MGNRYRKLTTLPWWKEGRKGKREKENSNILLDILTIILEKELKYHSETIDNLHLVQARNIEVKQAEELFHRVLERGPRQQHFVFLRGCEDNWANHNKNHSHAKASLGISISPIPLVVAEIQHPPSIKHRNKIRRQRYKKCGLCLRFQDPVNVVCYFGFSWDV